ncbi:MAG: universal stress protein [Dehalococcoidia bacterium]
MRSPSYETVLVPLDGSELADAAVPWAILIARKTGAWLNLVTVLPHGADPKVDHPDHATQRSLAQARENAGVLTPRTATSILAGDSATEIDRESRAMAADLIVMASHGRSGIARTLLGSVTSRVLRLSNVPVLVVKPSTSPYPEIEMVVAPLDGSEIGAAGLAHAVELSRECDSRLVLLHVSEDTADGNLARDLEVTAKDAERQGIEVDLVLVRGEAKDQIVAYADRSANAVIVLASIGATGIGPSRRGSVADHVVCHSSSPTMVVPPVEYVGPVIE